MDYNHKLLVHNICKLSQHFLWLILFRDCNRLIELDQAFNFRELLSKGLGIGIDSEILKCHNKIETDHFVRN